MCVCDYRDYIRDYCTLCVQVKFEGQTGHIEFNDEGHRTNFVLNVLEQSVDNDVVKVRAPSGFIYILHWQTAWLSP